MAMQARTFSVRDDGRVRVTIEVVDRDGKVARDQDGNAVLPNVYVGRAASVFMDLGNSQQADGCPRVTMAGAGPLPFQLDLLHRMAAGDGLSLVVEALEGIHETHCPFVHASVERVLSAVAAELERNGFTDHQGSRNEHQG